MVVAVVSQEWGNRGVAERQHSAPRWRNPDSDDRIERWYHGRVSGNRAFYRVELPPSFMIADVIRESERSIKAEVMDMSFAGAGLKMSEPGASNLVVDTRVALEFKGPRELGQGIRVGATVKHVGALEDGEGVIVGVAFDDPKAVHRLVPAQLHHVFNRRKAFRVEPARGEVIMVEVRSSSPTPEAKPGLGRMVDLSATGIGILVDEPTARHYKDVLELSLHFKLPTAPEAIALDATLRSKVPRDRGERWGLLFESRGSRDGAAHVRTISHYLLRRQLATRAVL